MEMLFASSNQNKIREISEMLGDRFQLLGLEDVQCYEEIPETSGTIEGNAIQKAMYVYDKYGLDCFAEDTGLEVKALDMRPGVYTARYAGEAKDPEANMAKVLAELSGRGDRMARFRTVIAYVKKGEVMTFEGIVEGNIALAKQGEKGFGYDPIFLPEQNQRSFAQMEPHEKNAISHRARAFRKFMEFLKI